jgi:hypothetical protein
VSGSGNNAAHAASLSYAHNAHFDKNKQCSVCHTVEPDGDTSHISGTTLVDRSNAAFGEATVGGSQGITYSNPNCTDGFGGLGCHATGGSSARNWTDTSIACTGCHTDTTTVSVNPVTGLHSANGSYPNVEGHDGTFGSSSQYGCTDCHDSAGPSGGHATGVKQSPADTTFNWNLTDKSITLSALGDTTDNTCTAMCHDDNNNWVRQWSKDAYSSATAAGDARCNVCHGQWNNLGSGDGWRSGTSHFRKTSSDNLDGRSVHDSNGDCDVCHAYTTQSDYHEDEANSGNLTMNSKATLTAQASNYYCAGGGTQCHDSGDANFADRQFPASNAFDPFENVTGPDISAGGAPGAGCKGCHNTTQGSRRSPMSEFNSTAQHAENWAGLNDSDCEKCHYALHGGTLTFWIDAAGSDHPASPQLGVDYFEFTAGTDNARVVNQLCISCHDGSYNALTANDDGSVGWQTRAAASGD